MGALNPRYLHSLSWEDDQACFRYTEEDTIPAMFWVELGNAFEFQYTLRKRYIKLTILVRGKVLHEDCG